MFNIYKNFFNILSPDWRRKSFVVLFLMLFGTFLETLGIGLVIPAITIMMDADIVKNYPIFNSKLTYFDNASHGTIILGGLSILLLFYFLKAIYLSVMVYFQAKFIYGIKEFISAKLFEKYLFVKYEYHLSSNSSKLIRNLTTEMIQLANYFLLPSIVLITEITVMIAFSCLLFYFEPLGFLILIIFLSTILFIYYIVMKNRLNAWGALRQNHEGVRIQKAQEAFAGSKDVRVLGCEKYFEKTYRKHNTLASVIERKQHFIAHLPKLWLEAIGVFGLVILAVFALDRTNNPIDVIPVIAMFAAAAFRILPAINRIITSLQSLRYSKVVTDLIVNEINNITVNISSNKDVVFEHKIELRNITFSYANDIKPTLSNISLKINKGECIGLIGPSGSGKSTLIDILLGLLVPNQGSILVDNLDITNRLRGWQKMVGYVQQNVYITDDTLRRNIAFGIEDDEIDKNRLSSAVSTANLSNLVNESANGLDTIIGEAGSRLSGGQKQRIGIARALYHNPPFLIFDESTSALDIQTESVIMKEIYKMKGARTILIITHRLSTIESCDRVYEINNCSLKQI